MKKLQEIYIFSLKTKLHITMTICLAYCIFAFFKLITKQFIRAAVSYRKTEQKVQSSHTLSPLSFPPS